MAISEEYKAFLEGEKHGIEYALSLLLIHKESLERTLENINKQLDCKEIKNANIKEMEL